MEPLLAHASGYLLAIEKVGDGGQALAEMPKVHDLEDNFIFMRVHDELAFKPGKSIRKDGGTYFRGRFTRACWLFRCVSEGQSTRRQRLSDGRLGEAGLFLYLAQGASGLVEWRAYFEYAVFRFREKSNNIVRYWGRPVECTWPCSASTM